MRFLGVLGAVACLSMTARAETVAYAAVTTFNALPMACQSVSFGPDAGGFDPFPSRTPEERYTAVMLTLDVTSSETRSFEGQVIADPPASLRIPEGVSVWVMKGQAESICPRLRQPTLRMRLVQHGCDTWPRQGSCLKLGTLRFVELDD